MARMEMMDQVPCSISCATNRELRLMLYKYSYTAHYRQLIAREVLRRLNKGEKVWEDKN